MKSRERLSRLFRGKDIDRVPIWLLNPYHTIKWYPDIYSISSYKKVVEKMYSFCDIFDRRYYDRGFCYSDSPEIIQYSENEKIPGGIREKETVRYGGIELVKYIEKGTDGTKKKYFVDSIDELNSILAMPYVAVKPDVTPYWVEKEELGDRGLMMLDLGDPLEVLYHTMSAENFSILSLTDYSKIIEFTDVMYERVFNFYKYFLERDIGEVFFIVGSEFAGPPLVSPDKFNELSVRYVKGLVDLIRSYGKWSIVHYHGNLFHVLPGMREIGMNGLHTVEAPPIGDCTISQARESLGETTILIGNIQYDDLKHKKPEEIRSQVESVIEEGKSGRFILSPTAGPYEETLDTRTAENYLNFIEAGIEYGTL